MWEANGGKLDTMRTGVQSLFGQLFREETARKVYRGMKPRAQEGLYMGGRPYGYKPLIEETRNIDDKGKLKIEEDEAKIVVRIFEERAQGKSPRLIAAGLNWENIPSPRGGKWNASTINGQKGRGIGIFHNELYVGRYRWNKLKFKKPPGSNKRISVSKDEAEHVIVDVPEYRIVEQVLWDNVQAIIGESGATHMSHRRTPPRLLSQLLKCPACGGGMSSYGVEKKTGKIRVGCSTHKESRSCSDPRTFYLEWIEETVVETLKKGLAEPAVIQRAIKAYEDERRRVAAEAIDEKASVEKRIADLSRKITRLNQMLIAEIGDEEENSRAVKEAATEKRNLEVRLEVLKQETPDNVVKLRSSAVERYLSAIQGLRKAIESRALAGDLGPAMVIREFIDSVYVHGEKDSKPKWVEVKGRLARLFDHSAQLQSFPMEACINSSWGKGGSGGGI
ncbi:recombinase family protein [Microvirga aerilata]